VGSQPPLDATARALDTARQDYGNAVTAHATRPTSTSLDAVQTAAGVYRAALRDWADDRGLRVRLPK